MMEPGLYHVLFVSIALFFIGVLGFFTRRNLITMLMSIELILNSVNLNFIAFNKYVWPGKMDGLFFTIFIIAIAAAEGAQVIRILMDELTRVASHELWWGAMAMDLGAFTPFFHAFRERESINEIMEETCGARLTMNYMVPGGVMQDLHPDFQRKVKEFLKLYKRKIHEYDELVTGNIIFQNRMKGVGVLTAEDAISYGVSGPAARGSGVSCDIRKVYPYEIYDKLEFDEVLETGCDSFARYMVRIREMQQSIHIIEQLIDNIPEGDFQAKTKAVLKLPKGEFYTKVETARGELGVYIVSEGGTTPYRIKFRSPGFSNLSVLDHIARGSKIGDLVAMMGTLDLVIPDIDR